MKARLARWWPALPAALVLYLGGESFLAKYPSFSGHRSGRQAASAGADSLLMLAQASAAADSGSAAAGAGAKENPFRAAVEKRPAGQGGGRPQAPPPLRRYTLKGTVGTNVATIANAAGQKLIVKVGDFVDSAEVVSIELNKVVLKDRAGKFDLFLEK